MNSILQYKTELKNKLNINDEELGIMFKSTLYPLMARLEQIGGCDFIASLMKLDYDEMVVFCPDIESVRHFQSSNNIGDVNVKSDDGEHKCFKCLCGKQHLINLHLFDHADCDNKLVIGSTCIKQIEKFKLVYSADQALCQKLDSILASLKTSEKLITHKPCYKCNDLVIKKDYEYAKPDLMNYCRDCLVGHDKNFIHCKMCKHRVIPASEPLPYDNKKFKEICKSCWYAQNKNKSWMRNNRN